MTTDSRNLPGDAVVWWCVCDRNLRRHYATLTAVQLVLNRTDWSQVYISDKWSALAAWAIVKITKKSPSVSVLIVPVMPFLGWMYRTWCTSDNPVLLPSILTTNPHTENINAKYKLNSLLQYLFWFQNKPSLMGCTTILVYHGIRSTYVLYRIKMYATRIVKNLTVDSKYEHDIFDLATHRFRIMVLMRASC